jgi:hypothetical protein
MLLLLWHFYLWHNQFKVDDTSENLIHCWRNVISFNSHHDNINKLIMTWIKVGVGQCWLFFPNVASSSRVGCITICHGRSKDFKNNVQPRLFWKGPIWSCGSGSAIQVRSVCIILNAPNTWVEWHLNLVGFSFSKLDRYPLVLEILWPYLWSKCTKLMTSHIKKIMS